MAKPFYKVFLLPTNRAFKTKYLIDPRTTHWAMMEGFAPTILICISYVILVKKIGPYLMESRKPFQLRGILIVYNSAMVVLSTYLFYEVSKTPLYKYINLYNTNIMCE